MNSNLQNLDDLDVFEVVVVDVNVGCAENDGISSSDYVHHHFQ